MPTCNIDARGKRARLVCGLLFVAAGVVILLAWALPFGSLAGTIAGVSCLLGGGFAIYEARAGWCALRAMGVRTPI